jgi:hypothetical protein
MLSTALAFGRGARDVAGQSKKPAAGQRAGNDRITPGSSGAGARRRL